MRALVLTTSYPVRPSSVSGSFVRDLLAALVARGWRFDVVAPAGGPGAALPGAPGITVHEAAHFGSRFAGGLAHRRGIPETLAAEPWKWTLAPAMVASLHATARAVMAGGVDVVWSHWLVPCGLLGADLAARAGVPHVATAHGADVHLLERLAALPGARGALRAAWERTALVAPAEHTAARVSRALGGREVSVAPLLAAGGAPRERAGGAGAPRLLFLGRFEPIKGPDLLLEACARVPGGRLSEVTLAGEGSLGARLRQRAALLPHATRFPGVLEAGGKREALRRADALVVASRRLPGGRHEGFPHAAMEALADGLPVIAPREGALGEWIERAGAGLTYHAAPRDGARAHALAGAIERFASDPPLRARLAAAAREAGSAFGEAPALAAWTRLLAGAA